MIGKVFALLWLVASLGSNAGAAQNAGLAPLFTTHDWLNGSVNEQSLRGKVVVVDVFTFGCYNCKNVTPNLRALNRNRSADVAIVGVHAPETKYESVRANVVEQLKGQGIVWPVAIDNDFALWHAFGIEYWPTQLIFDRHGRLRSTVIGDSQDEQLNATIAKLVAEH